MKPLVSVIVAVYNVGEFLEQCIESIVNQTEKEIEIILVDDGSTDNSAEICDRYAAGDSRIRVIHQANAGVSVARNVGMEAANADWIMFVDGDDWLTPDAVESLYENVKSDDVCDVFVGSFYYNCPNLEIFAGKNTENNIRYEYDLLVCRKEILSYILAKVEIPELRRMNCDLGVSWARLYRSEFLLKNGVSYVPGQKLCEDQVFNLYTAQHARKIVVLNRPVYHYRVWENSFLQQVASNRVPLDVLSFRQEEIRRFFDQLEDKESFDELYNLYVFRRAKEVANMYFGSFLLGEMSYQETVKKISSAISSIYCPEEELRGSKYITGKDKIIFTLLRHKNYFLLRFVWKFRAMVKKTADKQRGISLRL